MKIGIYNPYFDSFGGGERYVLTLAEHWSQKHDVHIFWRDTTILEEASKRFNLNLSRVSVDANVFLDGSLLQKISTTKSFDAMVILSDGSVPMSLAKRNILHFQVPFTHVSMPFWKSMMYSTIVCNSEFTKKYLDPSISIKRVVIYPPVDVEKIKLGKKEKSIVTVGRFNGLYNAKKQQVLIDAFKKASKNNALKGWKFQLAGSMLESDKEFLDSLEKSAKGFPIEFYPNCSFERLQSLYSTASIYWHAAGFGETKPEHMEHFGISTVEAMAAEGVPVVFNGGGQPEIVQDGVSGNVWATPEELIEKTVQIICNESLRSTLSKEAKKRSDIFSKYRFEQSIDALLR
jgi:glycosyltransferase involved in cell wall biosynthesis